MNVRYCRAPSKQLRKYLSPGGFLAPLLEPRTAVGVPVDVHFREDDHLHLYCGLTRIVDARLSGTDAILTAHRTYKEQDCAEPLFRRWRASEPGLSEAIVAYARRVEVAPRHTAKEGAIQSAWCQIQEPWMPFDREAVIGYECSEAQRLGRDSKTVDEAREELARLASDNRRWSFPPSTVPEKVDQLAVDSDGRLVLIELKYASASAATVFYAPLQLLQYVHEWHNVLDRLLPFLQRILDARVELGISPIRTPKLLSAIRPVIGFGADTRSREVAHRYAEVLSVVNGYLPAGVGQIETWTIGQGQPRQIDH